MSATNVNVLAVKGLLKMAGLPPAQHRCEMLGDMLRDGKAHFFSDRTSYGLRKLDSARALQDKDVLRFARSPEPCMDDDWYTVELTPAALAALAAFPEAK